MKLDKQGSTSIIRRAGGVATACLMLLLCTLPATAQTIETGAIVGRAEDSTGAVIPGVEVTITSPQLIGGAHTEVTDEQGTYRFELLRPGAYRVSFALPGFNIINIDDVGVQANITMTINGPMQVSSTTEEITVVSQVPTIDLEAATIGVNWSQKMMEDLPWSRSLTGISSMIPGAYATSYDIGNSNFANGSTIAAQNGGYSGGSIISVDGLVWCQAYFDFGSFEEMNISQSAKGADQLSAGIVMNMIVKGGGNRFHGNISTNYQNGSMQSLNVDQNLLNEGYTPGNSKYTHFTDYYGDVGGPILPNLKDKLWFYVAGRWGYQGQYIPGFLNGVGGTQALFYSELRAPSAKLTYQLTPKQKLEAYWSTPNKYQPFRGGSSKEPQDATQDQDSWAGLGPILTWTDILNSRTTATAKLSRGGYWWPAYAYSMPSGLGPDLGVTGVPGLTSQPIPTVTFTGVNNVGVHVSDLTSGATDGAYNANYTRPTRWQWNGDVSRVTTIFGKANEVKAGYMGWWEIASHTINFGYPYQEAYRYQSLSTESCPNNIICSNYFLHPNSVTLTDLPNISSSGGKYEGSYFNDKITVNRKLTLNLGVRFDWSGSFLPAQGNAGTGPFAQAYTIPRETGITNPSGYLSPSQVGSYAPFPVYHLWSPRLSFAYDVLGNGKFALKASYGKYSTLTSSPGAQLGPVSAGTTGVSPLSTKSCTFNDWNGVIPYVPDFGSQNYLGSPTNVNLAAACPGSGSNGIHNFDPSLSAVYLNEYTAGVEIGFNRNYSIRANVARRLNVGGDVAVNALLPYTAYTNAACAADPITKVQDVCYYTVPSNYPNRLLTDINYVNYNESTHEGQSMYTAYDLTFNKQYANRWSLLMGLGLDLIHPNTTNPLTPNAMLYNSQSDLPSWDPSLKINGSYELPGIPLFFGNKFLRGLMWSSTLTSQKGAWYGRSANVKDALGTTDTVTVEGHLGRYPTVTDWDQRIAKRFRFGDRHSLEIRWDLYNTLNANTITAWQSTNSSSSTYFQPNGSPLVPGTILSPRIYEWGASYRF